MNTPREQVCPAGIAHLVGHGETESAVRKESILHPEQEAKGTGHPEFEGLSGAGGHSVLVNTTDLEEANKQELQYGYHKYVSGVKYSQKTAPITSS